MNQKHQQSIFHVNINVNLMEQKVSQINGEITINVNVSVKKHSTYEKDYVWNHVTCN